MDYKRKIDFALNLLRSIPQDEGVIEISYSGGKDSDVILELAKMAQIPFEAIYKNTTIDPSGTIAHAKAMGATIVQPKMTFLQLIEKKGFPTRRARFCCEVLKEYKIHDRAVQGIRRDESTARAQRYHEPEMCRNYRKGEKARIYFPILNWTREDIARFVEERGIKCHPLYYDENGVFHPERRLGCIGCPLASDNGVKDFLTYPKMLKSWLNAGKKYFESHPDARGVQKFGTPYNAMVHNLFFSSYEEYANVFGGGQLFPEEQVDAKEFLENKFNISL